MNTDEALNPRDTSCAPAAESEKHAAGAGDGVGDGAGDGDGVTLGAGGVPHPGCSVVAGSQAVPPPRGTAHRRTQRSTAPCASFSARPQVSSTTAPYQSTKP